MPELLGWLALAVAAIVGSTIGGVAGFGAGIIMMPAIAWVMGAKATVPVLTIAMFLGNGARVWFSRSEIDLRVVGRFIVGAVPTSIAGALLYARIEGEWISRMLGTFLLVSVPLRRWLLQSGARVRLRHFPVIGAVFGFLSALVASVGPIMTPFFLAYGLRRGGYLATDALCSLGMYVARLIVFRRHELLTPTTLAVGLYLGGVAIGGAWIGRRLIERMSERVFLRILETLLILLGIQLVVWPAR